MKTAEYECSKCGSIFIIDTENEPKDMDSEKPHLCLKFTCEPRVMSYGIGKLIGWTEIH